ncbi:hypothetical protein [Bradyrhizobium canariense]|uniref:Uncharacterized protein n=1 Tax=Bradyrhizobium canariense TaxID=255045 RepID=A0A1H1MS33_9BRAD|nr:hypothetical protein [Bradyrhizobium canariense]SDR89733.1 hypothetical protein SAMN05444158_0346 [Bradyrhizobium canariense]
MMVYQEKIAPPGPLPILESDGADVLIFHRTIESLERENRWLKQVLARLSGLKRD